MSYHCETHGWRHMLNPCPSCLNQNVVTISGSSASHDLFLGNIEKLEAERDRYRQALEVVKEKTFSDPAEGPELRARAAFVYSAVCKALAPAAKGQRKEI